MHYLPPLYDLYSGILYYFWMRKTMKIMNFQSDVHSAEEVVKGWEIVQKTSNVSEEFNGRTFRYEFFRRTHPWSVQNNTWKREFSQKSDFSTFFRWMSSSKYEFLHVRTHPFDVNWYSLNNIDNAMKIYGLWKKSWKFGFSEKHFRESKFQFLKKSFRLKIMIVLLFLGL